MLQEINYINYKEGFRNGNAILVLKGKEFDQGALSPSFPIRFGLARRLLLSEFRRVFKRTALATKALLFSLLQDFFYITPRVKSAGYWKYKIA